MAIYQPTDRRDLIKAFEHCKNWRALVRRHGACGPGPGTPAAVTLYRDREEVSSGEQPQTVIILAITITT